MSSLVGSIQHIFENVIIRHFEADGTRTDSNGNVVGDTRVFRALLGMAELMQDVGKNTLRDYNIFHVHPSISGARIKPSVVAKFEKDNGRLPQAGDRISFTSTGDVCAPTDKRIGNGQYVIKTPEAEEASPGTKDCILEYTGLTKVVIHAVDQAAVMTSAAVETDVEDAPW